MGYDPMEYAREQAGVLGRTTEVIGGAIGNFAEQISKVVQLKNANKHVDNLYKTAVLTFQNELKNYNVPDDKIAIATRKYFLPLSKDMDAGSNLQMLVNSSKNADKYIEDQKTKYEQQKVGEGITKLYGNQTPIGTTTVPNAEPQPQPPQQNFAPLTSSMLGRQVAPMTNDAVQNASQAPQETPIPATNAPEEEIINRGTAYGRWGEAAAKKEVPYQTTEQLESNPYFQKYPVKTPEQMREEWLVKQKTPEQIALEQEAKKRSDPLLKLHIQKEQLDIEKKRLDLALKNKQLKQGGTKGVYQQSFDNEMKILQYKTKVQTMNTALEKLNQYYIDNADNPDPTKLNELQTNLEAAEYIGDMSPTSIQTATAISRLDLRNANSRVKEAQKATEIAAKLDESDAAKAWKQAHEETNPNQGKKLVKVWNQTTNKFDEVWK